MHYFRFLTRGDLSPETLNNCGEILDFRGGVPRSAGDVLVYTKRWLGDKSVVKIVSLVPQARAEEIRQCIHSPAGIAQKRTISDKVKQQIQRKAPVCLRNGDISRDAYDYLVGWSQGILPEVPRPAQYGILNYRWDSSSGPAHPGTLIAPHRWKIWDLGVDPDDGVSDTDSSEGDINGQD